MQDLVTANKINALVIFPQESAALTKPVQQVQSKGVYVTVVDRGLTDESGQDAYVAGDNTAFGKVPAEYLAKALGGKGNIVALRGIATTLDNERMDAFNASDQGRTPACNLLDAKYANWNRDDAFKVMQDLSDPLQADRRGVGGRRRHGRRRAQGDRPGQAHRHQARLRRRRREGHDQDRSRTAPTRASRPMCRIRRSSSTTRSSSPPRARLKGEKLPAKTIIPSVLITKDNGEGFLLPRLAVLT